MELAEHIGYNGGYFIEGTSGDAALNVAVALPLIEKLFSGFEPEMTEVGIGTISELYYGDPPHKGKGAISQAWSVAELLRINHLIKQYE